MAAYVENSTSICIIPIFSIFMRKYKCEDQDTLPSLPSSLVNMPVSLSELLKLLLLGTGLPSIPDTSIGWGGGASRRLRRVRALAVSSRTCACGVANPIARGDSVRTLRLRLPQLAPVRQNLLAVPNDVR